VDNSLLECINIAQSTLETDCVSSATEPGITRIHYPSPNDLFGQVDRVDEALLKCINLEESTLSAEQQNAQEAKFNKDFDDFINRIEPLGSGPIQLNPELLNPNDNQEFINHINNMETLDEFDDLEDWSFDIDLFMESLIHPDKIEELWHISKAKRMWEEF
jgi:hypothetical protein